MDSTPVRFLGPLQPPDASQADAFDEFQLRLAAALCCTVSGATASATLGGVGGVGAGAGAAGVGAAAGESEEPPPEHPTSNSDAQSATALKLASVLDLSRSGGTTLPRFTFPNVRRWQSANNCRMLPIRAGLAARPGPAGSHRRANANEERKARRYQIQTRPRLTWGRIVADERAKLPTSAPALTDGRRKQYTIRAPKHRFTTTQSKPYQRVDADCRQALSVKSPVPGLLDTARVFPVYWPPAGHIGNAISSHA